MKTVVIWDSVEADLRFFVVDRDLGHLDGKYVNSADNTEALDKEISMLVYDETTGKQVIEMTKEFPVEAVREGAKVIVCGFLP
jgi:hypothetical protein